jgi:hypothetical protein
MKVEPRKAIMFKGVLLAGLVGYVVVVVLVSALAWLGFRFA